MLRKVRIILDSQTKKGVKEHKMVKLCFNQATTLKNSNLEKDLELCEKHGYDYIEIRIEDKLPEYLKTHTSDDLVSFFKESHLKPLALNALQFFNNRNEADAEMIVSEFKELVQTAHLIGAPYIVAVPLVTEEKILKRDIKESCVKVLRELSSIAQPYGIKIAMEFIGHPQCTVNTFGQAYEIVEAVGRENVGVVLDCFHFHAMGSELADLKKADISKIFICHIDDTEDFPIGSLRDEDRLWPGLGVVDLTGILGMLKEKDFDGAMSVELFRPEYYELSADEAIKVGKETSLAVIENIWK